MSKTSEIHNLLSNGRSPKDIIAAGYTKTLVYRVVKQSRISLNNVENDDDSIIDNKTFELNQVKYESELQDYTENHINEMGFCDKELEIFIDEFDQHGKEYTMSIGRADLIFIDDEKNIYIVEFKRDANSDKVVGQILRYMGYMRQNIAENKVFGFIVTNKINDKIKCAASEIPNISLFEYNLNITVNKIDKNIIRE